MRSRLIITIFLAAALVLVGHQVGNAAKKIAVEGAKSQTAKVNPAQPEKPVTQPEAASQPPALTTPDTDGDRLIYNIQRQANNLASPKAGEQINWQVLASGGGTQTVGSYVLGSTIGQTAAGTSSAGSYVLQSGYWQNFSGGSYLCGDANRTGDVNISDVVFLVAYIFAYGPAPDPLASGDADCDGMISISDCVYLVAYIFAYGPAPCAACK